MLHRSKSVALGAVSGLLLVLAGGCSPKISAAKVDALRLKQTDEPELKKMFGSPQNISAYSDTNGGSVVCDFANVGGTAIGPYRLVMLESLIVEFRDSKLNGYVFFSNDGENATKVDPEGVKGLKVGQTKQADVQRLMGKPAGRVLMPSRLPDLVDLAKPGTSEVWAYTTAEKINGFLWQSPTFRMVLVAFDAGGNVTNVAEQTVTRNTTSRRAF